MAVFYNVNSSESCVIAGKVHFKVYPDATKKRPIFSSLSQLK